MLRECLVSCGCDINNDFSSRAKTMDGAGQSYPSGGGYLSGAVFQRHHSEGERMSVSFLRVPDVLVTLAIWDQILFYPACIALLFEAYLLAWY